MATTQLERFLKRWRTDEDGKRTGGEVTDFRLIASVRTLAHYLFAEIANVYYRPGGTDVAVADGGTGLGTVAQGDLLYGSAADTISRLAKNTSSTRVLTNTGSSNNPAWAQVTLTTGVTGTLPVANGGTGGATALLGRNGLGIFSKYRTTTQAKVNNTFADDDTLNITGLDSSKGYEVFLFYIASCPSATPDIKFQFVVDAGTVKAMQAFSELGPTDSTGTFGASSARAVNIDTTDSVIIACGSFTGATSIKVQFAQNSTDAGNATTVQAGSYLKVTALN